MKIVPSSESNRNDTNKSLNEETLQTENQYPKLRQKNSLSPKR